MAEISKITLPSGTTYDLKDATARAAIAGGTSFLGITTTELTDGASTSPIVIDGEDVNAINGGIAIYNNKEFIYSDKDSEWHEFGDLSTLGALAQKDSASGTYTPAGSVSLSGSAATVSSAASGTATYTPAGSIAVNASSGSGTSYTPEGSISVNAASGSGTSYTPEGSVGAPTISVSSAGSTTTIHNPTKATVATAVTAAAPGATAPSNSITYYSVSNETLSFYQIGYDTGDSISTSDVTVKTGDASYSATAPTFTGTEKKLAFSGTEKKLAFSGTAVRLETDTDVPTSGSFSGTQATITVS